MFKFCSLYSGSSGNSLLLQTSNTKVLIDAGESAKKITESLLALDINPNELDAILVTHEHCDHVKGLGTLSQKNNIPVYANSKTWDAMENQKSKIENYNQKFFVNNEKFEIGDIKVESFEIPHDAASPCGFNFFYKGKKISIATDIGHMTSSILHNLEDSSFLLLEANYDPSILKYSKYPYSLKERISGPNGHLSNSDAGKTVSHLIYSGLEIAMLGHLSKENNFPELAYKTVIDELIENNFDENKTNICVANRNASSPIIDLGA